MPVVIKGEVVGPQFELDTWQLDFNIVSYGFRYVVFGGVQCIIALSGG
jgi:hypothetical protein